ncbi:MAG: hypothetical protein U1F59_09035 [Candidatus Competibacteraceae bacterium]
MRDLPRAEIERRIRLGGGAIGPRQPARPSSKATVRGPAPAMAMGRALVRQPTVFLMDEPLSNLDARLRVQIRAELGELLDQLGATTIYVT